MSKPFARYGAAICLFCLVMANSFSASAQNSRIEAPLTHTSGYFYLYPYSSYWGTDSYAKVFYDGNKKRLQLWNSDINTDFTGIAAGHIWAKSTLNITHTERFDNLQTDNGQDHLVFQGKVYEAGSYYGGLTWKIGGRRRASIVATREHPDTDHMGIAFFTQGTDGPGPMYESMRLTHAGNLLIGRKSPLSNHYKLDVAGIIRADEIRVETSGADFVFADDYALLGLKELQDYITQHKHLPEIPSAAEMQQEGMAVGELNTKLLQKVEELTLYVIQQNERMDQLSQENEQLKAQQKELLQLKARIEKLENK